MTEAEWLTCEYPETMLKHIRSKNLRKCRLFACATCERLRPLVTAVGFKVLDVAERFADGLATQDEIKAAQPSEPGWSMAFGTTKDAGSAVAFTVELLEEMYDDPEKKEDNLVGCLFAYRWAAMATNDVPAEWRHQSNLLRDIFGNPFRPVAFSIEWLTDTALSLARQMYESRDFSAMPILADALQDAGCDNENVLNHCRERGEHVRGCWVVDLVLGRE
jgi:hypothetical protein